jgi:hypothetical protein
MEGNIDVAERAPATTRTVVAKTPGIAVGASMIIPGFGQLYANAVVLGLILFSFLIPGLTSLGQGVSPRFSGGYQLGPQFVDLACTYVLCECQTGFSQVASRLGASLEQDGLTWILSRC